MKLGVSQRAILVKIITSSRARDLHHGCRVNESACMLTFVFVADHWVGSGVLWHGGSSACWRAMAEAGSWRRSVMLQTCTHSANCADDRRDSPGAALGPVLDMPVVLRRHMLTVGQVLQIPQLQPSCSCLDKVVDMPVVCNDRCPWFSMQKTVKFPQLQCSFKVADVPVVQVVLVPQVLLRLWTSCDHAATSWGLANSRDASDSVHRRSQWTFLLTNRDWHAAFSSGGYGGDEGFFLPFGQFFALLQVVWS